MDEAGPSTSGAGETTKKSTVGHSGRRFRDTTEEALPPRLLELLPENIRTGLRDFGDTESDDETNSVYIVTGNQGLEKLFDSAQLCEERLERWDDDAESDSEFYTVTCLALPHFCMEGQSTDHSEEDHECLNANAVEILQRMHDRRATHGQMTDAKCFDRRMRYQTKLAHLEKFPQLRRRTAGLLGVPCVCYATEILAASTEKKRARDEEEEEERDRKRRADGARRPLFGHGGKLGNSSVRARLAPVELSSSEDDLDDQYNPEAGAPSGL